MSQFPIIRLAAGLAASLATLLALALPASAAGVHIQVQCSTASRSSMADLIPAYERATGNKIDITYGVANIMVKEMEAGEQFDAAILLNKPMDQLFKDGKLVAGTRIEMARLPVGVGIQQGGRKFDISTVDAFKKTLFDAKSIVYSGPGSSGVFFAGLLHRLGIYDALKPKLIAAVTGDAVGETLASGKAEIGIMPPSELLPVKNVEVLGLLPRDIQNYDVVVGGISANAKQAAAAKDFLKFLVSPQANAVYVKKGMQGL